MKKEDKWLIQGIVDAIELGEPDISTERLLSQAAEPATEVRS